MGRLTQITKHRGRIDRVPRGEVPVIELHTEWYQQIVSVKLRELSPFSSYERKTVDWQYEYFLVTNLNQEDE